MVFIICSFHRKLMDIVCKSRKHAFKTWIPSYLIKFTIEKMWKLQFLQFSSSAHSTVKFDPQVISYVRTHMLHAFWQIWNLFRYHWFKVMTLGLWTSKNEFFSFWLCSLEHEMTALHNIHSNGSWEVYLHAHMIPWHLHRTYN